MLLGPCAKLAVSAEVPGAERAVARDLPHLRRAEGMEQIGGHEASRGRESRTDGGHRLYDEGVPADSLFKFAPSRNLLCMAESAHPMQVGEPHVLPHHPGIEERIAPCPTVLRGMPAE